MYNFMTQNYRTCQLNFEHLKLMHTIFKHNHASLMLNLNLPHLQDHCWRWNLLQNNLSKHNNIRSIEYEVQSLLEVHGCRFWAWTTHTFAFEACLKIGWPGIKRSFGAGKEGPEPRKCPYVQIHIMSQYSSKTVKEIYQVPNISWEM